MRSVRREGGSKALAPFVEVVPDGYSTLRHQIRDLPHTGGSIAFVSLYWNADALNAWIELMGILNAQNQPGNAHPTPA